MESIEQPCIDWAVAAMTLAGQAASGDRHVVHPFQNGVVVGVIDGLGHGPEAAHAASLAVRIVECHAAEPIVSVVRRCHDALVGTRGAVISLASYELRDNAITWLGVGNVEGLLLRSTPNKTVHDQWLLLRSGVVGRQLPMLRSAVVSVGRGDLLIMASDGIGGEFANNITPSDPTQRIADRILREHGKKTDDALVLVARYLGHRGAPM